MRGVKIDILGGLFRKPPSIVEHFIAQYTSMEQALLARASHFHRHSRATASSPSGFNISPGIPGIHNLKRKVVQKGLRKLLPAARWHRPVFTLHRRSRDRTG